MDKQDSDGNKALVMYLKTAMLLAEHNSMQDRDLRDAVGA